MIYQVRSLHDGHTLLCVDAPAAPDGIESAKGAATVALHAEDDVAGLYGDDGTYYGTLNITGQQFTSNHYSASRESVAYCGDQYREQTGAMR